MKIRKIVLRTSAFICVAIVAAVALYSYSPDVSSQTTELEDGLNCPTAPTISLYPTEFATTEAGMTSGPMAAIVTNTSNESITISATSIDDQTNFSMPSAENGCLGRRLQRRNDYCTINLYFQPQTAGHLSTTLSATYYHGRKATAVVAGRAFVPPVTPATSAVDFGQKTINSGRETRTGTLTNNALVPIEITSIRIVSAGAAPTSFDAEQTCVTTIAAGATCELVLGFDPTEAADFTASAVIRDAFDQDAHIELAGTGVAPGDPDISLSTHALEFGRVQVGSTSSSMPVTLVSTGTVNLTVTSITASGDFAVTNAGDCVKVLTPTEHCTIQAQFTPSVGGERAGQITITDDAPDSPQAVTLSGVGVDPEHPSVDLSTTSLDFGNQTVGTTGETLYVVVSNVGGAALTVSNVTVSGDFSQVTDCVGTVAAGGRCAVAVTFAPTALGDRPGQIQITDDAAGSPHTVNLEGDGTEQGTPQASLSATSLDFGNQQIETQSAAQTVVLTNTGTADLSIGLTSIDGEGSASFGKGDSCRESVVEPGTSCSIDVIFTPQGEGTFGANLSIDDDASGSPHTVALSGTGVSSSGGGCSLISGALRGAWFK